MSTLTVSGISPGMTAKDMAERILAMSRTVAVTTTLKKPCYYKFTGVKCPGPAFNQCPAGSRCDIDVGRCVAPENGRTDCITDYSQRGPMTGGRRHAHRSRKNVRRYSGRSRKLRKH
jgi:hypothetical protein